MVKNKVTETKIPDVARIGEVVAWDAEIFTERAKNIAQLECAAKEILKECQQRQGELWEDITNKYKLSKKYLYQLKRKTSTIVIIGINHNFSTCEDE